MENPTEDCVSVNQFSCQYLTRLSVKMDNGIGNLLRINIILKLIIYILGKIFNWKEIKELIGGYSACLKYLRLELEVTFDVLDGEKWENFLKKFLCLKIFHVKFSSHDIVDWNEILNRFRSQFWCEEKQWYFVADKSLRSISLDHGIRRMLPINREIPSHTAPNDDWFYSDSFLVFDTDEYTDNCLETSKHLQRLLNGEALYLTGQLETFSIELLITLLKNRVNLSEITTIYSFTSPVTIELLDKLKKEMPDLSKLTMRLSLNENNVTDLPRFDSIRQIDYRSQLPQQMTKHFIQIFFNLEHLIVEIELPEQILN